MWTAAICGFVGGLLAGNAAPHFLKGIARESYPTVLGDSALVNLVAGWAGLLLALAFLSLAGSRASWLVVELSAAPGVLVMGVFHAIGGAFWLKRRAARRTGERD
jgi:hypothetical protein